MHPALTLSLHPNLLLALEHLQSPPKRQPAQAILMPFWGGGGRGGADFGMGSGGFPAVPPIPNLKLDKIW
jgi:hypothetical protein